LSSISKEGKTKGTGLKFQPRFARKIANIMVKDDIQKVPKASGKLSQVLKTPKNVVNEIAKFSIYKIQCGLQWIDKTAN
jgi:hypothetical protein